MDIEVIVGYGGRGENIEVASPEDRLRRERERERELEIRPEIPFFGGRKEEIGVDRVCLLKGQGTQVIGQATLFTFTTEMNKHLM